MRQLKISTRITNRDSESIDRYLQEISSHPLINADEEVELARRIRSGDIQATQALVQANLRFVVSVAKQYQNQGVPLSDLINEGNMGLIKAANRFDETRGFKFISYAVWWIRQCIIYAISEQGRMVRLPANRISILNRINRAYSVLEQELEREPSEQEIADALSELSVSDVTLSLKANVRLISLDAPASDGSESPLSALIEDASITDPLQPMMQESMKEDVQHIIFVLGAKEAEVIRLHFGIGTEKPASLEEIGLILGLTRERVRQIKEKGIRRLRHNRKAQALRQYL